MRRCITNRSNRVSRSSNSTNSTNLMKRCFNEFGMMFRVCLE